jgi:anti-anti-sigma factor
MTLTELAQPTLPAAVFDASVSVERGAVVVAFRGEADLFTLPVVVGVLARVVADHDGPVIVDLVHTVFIDTGTVRAIARAWKFLDDRSRRLTVRSPSRMAIRMFALFGLTHLIEGNRRVDSRHHRRVHDDART